jgi:CubicO group peptidase (beta-lactamase class C family)
VGSVGELLGRAEHDVATGWLPACQLAVAKDGELVAFETFGGATNDTRFCMFSCIKPLVASAVWLLIGDGALDVSRSVGDHIPELAHLGPEVTVERVMLHTGGFPKAPMAAVEGGDRERRRERFATWRLEWEPGSRFAYHGGSAHWVLADLLDRLGGADYRDVLESRVFRPLGLPRVLGVTPEDVAPLVWLGDGEPDVMHAYDTPEVLAAGHPGGGGVATAATLALFYQALLHDPGGLWDAGVLHDVKTNVRCRFPDDLLGVPVNRTLGLVLAGDDGRHIERYASFGQACSPSTFGHAGAHGQVAWADPETGISFAYLTNGLDPDMMKEGLRSYALATRAAELDL